jgi:putative Holliday junction resolvase
MRYLGLDLGGRRIGLAISDASGTLARPLKTLERSGSDEDAIALVRLALEEVNRDLGGPSDHVGCLVFGLPSHLDGTPSEQTVRIRQFAELLSARLGLAMALQDERLSSREAEEKLSLGERDWRKRKKKLDAAAAAIILQDYLDRGRRP